MAVGESGEYGHPVLMGSKLHQGGTEKDVKETVLKQFVNAYQQSSMMRVFHVEYRDSYAGGVPTLIITATREKSSMADCKVLQPLLLMLCNKNIGTFCAVYDLRNFVPPPLRVLITLGRWLRPRLPSWKWNLVAAAVVVRNDKWGQVHKTAISTLLKLAPPITPVGTHHTEAEALAWLDQVRTTIRPKKPKPAPLMLEKAADEQEAEDPRELVDGACDSCPSSTRWFCSQYAIIACISYLITVAVCLLCYPDKFHFLRDPAVFGTRRATLRTLLGSAVVTVSTVFVLQRLMVCAQESSQGSPRSRTNSPSQAPATLQPRGFSNKATSEVFEESPKLSENGNGLPKKRAVWPKVPKLKLGFQEFKCPCVTRTRGESMDKRSINLRKDDRAST